MNETGRITASIRSDQTKRKRVSTPQRRKSFILGCVATGVFVVATAAWLGTKAVTINSELGAAVQLVPQLKSELLSAESEQASLTLSQLQTHTAAARDASQDPVWKLASTLPFLGSNLTAVTEVTRSADDVAVLGLRPLLRAYKSLDWDNLLPGSASTNLAPLRDAAPSITSAAYAVRASADRLETIDSSRLLPQVAGPLDAARNELKSVTDALDASANGAKLLPAMLGGESPRKYLLVVQNNAEARASGGIPGALAVLTLDQGKLSLDTQSSAGEVGVMSPTLPVDPEQRLIYSNRMGKFLQDVNLTPDFPTAAALAQAMWERKSGQRVDGVLSVDPIALSYVLEATGPVQLTSPELLSLAGDRLPTELNNKNVVQTLLSDVYLKIQHPRLQDAYFAGVAQEVFSALSEGRGEPRHLLEELSRGVDEGRVRVWSGHEREQAIIASYPVGGSVLGSTVQPAEFGVYVNDGTGAKMDYYVTRTVQLIKECPKDGYEQTTVRIVSTNTAPADAATLLPAYVTGGGAYGVPSGSVQTNLVAYGPMQASIETAKLDGQRTGFAPYFHGNRPVGVLAVLLAPGESKTVDIMFGKIAQHAEPNLVVTPTVQPVKDVTLPAKNAVCG